MSSGLGWVSRWFQGQADTDQVQLKVEESCRCCATTTSLYHKGTTASEDTALREQQDLQLLAKSAGPQGVVVGGCGQCVTQGQRSPQQVRQAQTVRPDS